MYNLTVTVELHRHVCAVVLLADNNDNNNNNNNNHENNNIYNNHFFLLLPHNLIKVYGYLTSLNN